MKLSDKLAKVNNTFEVTRYDNGYLVSVSGQDKDGGWASSKIIIDNLDQAVVLLQEYAEMEVDD